MLEHLGTGTFSYVRTVYNGLINRNGPVTSSTEVPDGTRAWRDFRDHHELGLAKICLRLANDGADGPLHSEVKDVEGKTGHNMRIFNEVVKCTPLPLDPDVENSEIIRWYRSHDLVTELENFLNDARTDNQATAKKRFKPFHKGAVKLIAGEQWEDDGRYARATIRLDEGIKVDRATQYDVLKSELGEKTLLELAAEHNFPIDVTINLALAGYHINFRTEAEMMAQIEKYTRSNLEHRRWLIIQLSDTKLKDLYPGYKLR